MKKDLVKGTPIGMPEQSGKGNRLPLLKFIICLVHAFRALARDCLKSRKWKIIYWKKKDKDGSELRIEVNINE
jgi:hypothetical protein